MTSKRTGRKSTSTGDATSGAKTGAARNGTRLSLVSNSGLVIEASTAADDGLLEEFYRDYDGAFVLANEKEGYDGFAECLGLNAGDRYANLVGRYGPFREFVAVVRDPATGVRLGGANFIIFPVSPATARELVLSINLNYVFVNAQLRRKGIFRQLMDGLPALAFRLFAETNASDLPKATRGAGEPQVYVFIEQNDPFRMSREDYDRDTELTGLDQVARIGLWSRLGARIVDFPYVQPPLSKDQEADDTLAYAVLGAPDADLDACLLRSHLERFFGISVLKGADLSVEPTARAQLAELAIRCKDNRRVPLLDGNVPVIESALAKTARRPATLREALRKSK
jgi:GNAT superfamily N-acetyltransferase